MRSLGRSGAYVFLLAGLASGGPAAAAALEAPAWAITPDDGVCRTDLELVSHSGAVAPVALLSDGEHVILRFAREGAPAEAFLPIRVDQRPYSNLVRRTGEEGLQLMALSDETLAAMKRGKMLQIAWLSDEAVSGSLAGAAQGLADLKTCGAQVAAQRRAHDAELEVQRSRAAADARAKALADEQLAAAKAQTAAAEAERQRLAAETRKANAEAEAASAQAEQNRAYADQQRERDQIDQQRAAYARQYYYRDRAPPPQDWGYYRPYYPQ
jgi:murein DD-endopeptidase MepM/ murein hydrolase activator NlpD